MRLFTLKRRPVLLLGLALLWAAGATGPVALAQTLPTAINRTAASAITGTITASGGAPLAGVTVTATLLGPPLKVFLPAVRKPAAGGAALTATAAQPAATVYTALTQADGAYALLNLPDGSYEVTAALAGYTFTPPKWNFILTGSKPNVGFTAKPVVIPPGMVLVPAGTFQMGCAPGDLRCFDPEKPLHTVTLSTYAIDKYEVTNRRYQACVGGGGCTAPRLLSSPTRANYFGNAAYDGYPVIYVTWSQADAFCQWDGKRLPTEAEWEKAARGSADTRLYPWGSASPDCTYANFAPDGVGFCVGDTTAVGSYPTDASPYGVMDMGGNVAEWVHDWYAAPYYAISPAVDPQGADSGPLRVLRGGNLGDGAASMRVTPRGALEPSTTDNRFGFRCALSR